MSVETLRQQNDGVQHGTQTHRTHKHKDTVARRYVALVLTLEEEYECVWERERATLEVCMSVGVRKGTHTHLTSPPPPHALRPSYRLLHLRKEEDEHLVDHVSSHSDANVPCKRVALEPPCTNTINEHERTQRTPTHTHTHTHK